MIRRLARRDALGQAEDSRQPESKGIDAWSEPFTFRRAPLAFILRADPLERSDDAVGYQAWLIDHAFYFVSTQQAVARFLSTFREVPPRQRPSSFSVDQVLERLEQAPSGLH
ncbi:hypothetical protein [Myxococcus fulvus]|uniref:hypothetical protein n=1 Tax=Myxococcus fulvus TaxID=33 RepID=UPI0020BFF79A|nr:hypothetical protein [Myxococcus fulvus]MCK8496916.1 hypothetical protein [Myxococcus fulvus]